MTDVPYASWPTRLERTTSLIAYGRLDRDGGKTERWQLASQYRIPECYMTPIDQETGLVTLIGHNFARVYYNGSHEVTRLDYLVPREEFSMGYKVYSMQDLYTVGVRPTNRVDVLISPEIRLRHNPSRAPVMVEYKLPSKCQVVLHVYDTGGRQVSRLDLGERRAGNHSVAWNGRNAAGVRVPSGVYWMRLVAGGLSSTRKAIVLQ